MPRYVLTLVCPDRIGIVHAVSGFLANQRCNILDSQQFGDPATGKFFMRVHFEGEASDFASVGAEYAMDWELSDEQARSRLLVLVSREGHCLNDLLYRWRIGALSGDIAGIVSNHPDFGPLATAYGVPYHHLPVSAQSRPRQEAALLDLVDRYDVGLVVLARYMQVLSARLCAQLPGRIINIHHSFLPSFKGARPYQQAYDRGVKLIGATAHYVTADLDEGPIIEQETARVDHTLTPEQLAAVGRDLEAVALAKAVQWHVEHRILRNGAKTVVFR
ncbi:MAG TPA: formyltetrahydrofolate deformylase [Jatrophihabitantaceae bacterium]|nr:formyltetrahydrofolate deformylase [Jatrophihabitantaceae bacterium]